MMIDDPTWIAIAIIGWLSIDEGYEIDQKSLTLKKLAIWLESGFIDLRVIWGPTSEDGQNSPSAGGGPGVYIFEGI